MNLYQSVQIDDITIQLRKKIQNYQRYTLKDDLIIGRDHNADIVYLHHMISKKHARIYYENGWKIEDLGSKNGVYVNKKRVMIHPLKIGDVISIVGFDIYFCEVFLNAPFPDNTSLPLYQPLYLQKKKSVNKQLCLLEKKQLPIFSLPQEKNSSFLRISDILHALIYPMVLFYHQQYSYFIWVSLSGLVLRLIEKLFLYIQFRIEKRKYLKWYQLEKSAYEKYLNQRFSDMDHLQNYQFIQDFHSLKVRLGTSQDGILLHDFSKHPRLLIVGDYNQRVQLLIQIVYQIERYYPWIQIDMNPVIHEFILCRSRIQQGREILGIQKAGRTYQIDHYDLWDECTQTYDAMIDLVEGCYFCGCKIYFTMDQLPTPYLLSDCFVMNLPVISYFEAVGLQLKDIYQIRKQYSIQSSLKGLLGYQKQEVAYIDLHEKKQGPHLLIAGMSGSGKSEWLTSFLLSIAIFYDSCDVQFFLIDFKGGALSSLFENLHHTSMVLSNLDHYQIHKAIAALEDEVMFREKRLLKVSEEVNEPVTDIHQLKKYYASKKITINLAHLLIVIDEFAELKLLYPEMMNSLIRIARTGRSLGIHLILSTQRPSGVIDRQIESNIQTKICFKVASKQDSYDVLGNNQAFLLTNAGDYISQMGTNFSNGKTVWVDKQIHSLNFYDLEFNEQMKIPLAENESSIKLDCIALINNYSQPIAPLYIKNIENQNIPEGALGIYDDYIHRQIVSFKLDRGIMVVGGRILELQDIKEVEYRLTSERILGKELEMKDYVLFFDKQVIWNLLGKKVTFEISKQRSLGAIYWKGGIYQCKIRYGVI